VHLRRLAGGRRPDRGLLAYIAEVRRVVEPAGRHDATSGISFASRSAGSFVEGASSTGHRERSADELSLKDVELGSSRRSATRQAEPGRCSEAELGPDSARVRARSLRRVRGAPDAAASVGPVTARAGRVAV